MKKYDWQEKDIIVGRIVCKRPKGKFSVNGWTAKWTLKIGWMSGVMDVNFHHPVCLIAMTDGMIYRAMTDKEMVEYFTLEDMVPMKHKWLMDTMEYLKGCYERDF